MQNPICSICIDTLKAPVALPCGHLHCQQCFKDYIDASDDAAEAVCPTCRSEFNLVTPDLTYVPEKYHPYIHSAVRRVYLDLEDAPAPAAASAAPADAERDRARIAELEARIRTLEGEKAELARQATAAADRHGHLQDLHTRTTAHHAQQAARGAQVTAALHGRVRSLLEALARKEREIQAGFGARMIRPPGPPPGPPPTRISPVSAPSKLVNTDNDSKAESHSVDAYPYSYEQYSLMLARARGMPQENPGAAGGSGAPVATPAGAEEAAQRNGGGAGSDLLRAQVQGASLKRARADDDDDEGAARPGPGPSTFAQLQARLHALAARPSSSRATPDHAMHAQAQEAGGNAVPTWWGS